MLEPGAHSQALASLSHLRWPRSKHFVPNSQQFLLLQNAYHWKAYSALGEKTK